MAVLTYIVINFIIFFTHFELAHKWLKPRGRSMTEVIVAGILSSNAQIILTIMVLGRLLKVLHVPGLFWTNAGVCIVLLLIAKWRPVDARLLLADIALWVRTGVRAIKGDTVLTILTILLALLFIWLLFLGILLPPYSWDGLVYHLSMVGYWIQDGRMGEHQVYAFHLMHNYPINMELIFYWNTVFFRNDTIINCTQLFYVPLGMLSIYLLARNTGRRRSLSMLAGMLFLTFPIVIQQSTTCYVDIAVNAIFLASLAFLARSRLEFSDIVYGAIGLGLFLGSKGGGPFFIIGALIPAFIYHAPYLLRHVGFKRLLVWLATGVFLIMLIGSWQYMRNWVVHGNPAYPYKVEVMGKTIFDGRLKLDRLEGAHLLKGWKEKIEARSPLGQVYFSWSEPGKRYLYDSRVGGLGAAHFVLLMPCLGAALLISLIRRDGKTFFTLIIILLAFWATPVGRFWVRYNFFVVGAFAISLAYILDLLRTSRAAHMLKSILLLLIIPTLFLGARGDADFLSPAQIKYFLSKPAHYWHSTQFTSGGWEPLFFRKIYELTKPGTVIAYDMHYTYSFKYPLWNRDFSNKVYYIKCEKNEGEQWEDVLKTWEEAIDEWNVDYWVSGKYSKSSKRARSKPDKFKLIRESTNLALFQVIKSSEPEADDET